MEKLKINGRMATVDTEKLSKGLYDLHCENEEKKAALCFGMLDKNLCDIMENNLKEKIFDQFSGIDQQLFEERIKAFCGACFDKICKGIYSCAKDIMIV